MGHVVEKKIEFSPTDSVREIKRKLKLAFTQEADSAKEDALLGKQMKFVSGEEASAANKRRLKEIESLLLKLKKI